MDGQVLANGKLAADQGDDPGDGEVDRVARGGGRDLTAQRAVAQGARVLKRVDGQEGRRQTVFEHFQRRADRRTDAAGRPPLAKQTEHYCLSMFREGFTLESSSNRRRRPPIGRVRRQWAVGFRLVALKARAEV